LGEGRYEYGDVSLDPERSFNLDASVRWDARRVHAEVSGFRNRIHDFTFISPTNETQDGLRVYRYGQGDATLVGGETSASIDATDILTLRGRFDAVRGTNETTDDPLPLMPPHREAIGVELHGNAGRLGAAYVSADLEHVARQDRLSDAERDATVEPGRFPLTTDAYTLLDLGAGIVVPVAHHATRLDLRVSNATDHQYRDFLSRYKEFAYAPGMNIIVRATTTF
jgi:outer membrane receptor protein involved in Fe transport